MAMMDFQSLEYEYSLDEYLNKLIKDTKLNSFNTAFLQKKDYFLFEKPIYVNYIIEDYQCIKNFIIKTIEKFLQGYNFDPKQQVIFQSPHEQINFSTRINTKDRKLPLFIITQDETPQTENIHSQIPYRMETPYFMQDTRTKTKQFLIDAYKQLYFQKDPKYTRENLRNKIYPTLFYDAISSSQKVSLDIIQETNVELQHLFQMFNTKIFINKKIKSNYIVQLDTLIKESNIQFKDIQDRFQFPLFYIINYFVEWVGYSNITTMDKNIYNLQKQKYEFKFDLLPITRFNISANLLKMDIDLGVMNRGVDFTESDGFDSELVETIRKYKIR